MPWRPRFQGYFMPGGQQAVGVVTEEYRDLPDGATILVHGIKATRGDAAFTNAEMILAGGKWDTFRMLTDPSTTIIPAALAAAETGQAPGKEFLTGVAAGYEVMERIAGDFIATVMARGFHAGPVFGIFGGAVTAISRHLALLHPAATDVLNMAATFYTALCQRETNPHRPHRAA